MAFFYRSKRIGRGGKPFDLLKIRTLKNGADTSPFAVREQYTFLGRFLRKIKADELPQIYNVLKGELSIFGYRAEEERTWKVLPKEIRDILSQHKPGIIDLASLHFFDEEHILQINGDFHKNYWEKIRPMKLVLQMFYLENRCWILNVAIIYIYLKKVVWSIFKK